MIRVAADMMSIRKRNGTWHGLTVHDQVEPADAVSTRSTSDETTPARSAGEGDGNTTLTSASTSGTHRSLVVDRVEANGPAARAGLQPGDVIARAGDLNVTCSLDLERALLDRAVGERVPVQIRRGGKEQRLEVALQAADRAAPVPAEIVWQKLGLRLQAVSGEVVAQTNQQLHGGLLVVDVRADGAAGKAGIQRGDVLVGLHQWEMLTPDNVVFVLTRPDLASFNPLRFYIVRNGQVHRGWIQQVE
jgi:serine protease Do